MVTDSKRFTDEMMQLVAKKHSKDHPIFPMIARGELSDDALKGFVKQFYLLFPKPFPKPIAAMFSRCPDDPELERMWTENLMEEAAGEESGTASHKELYLRFAASMGIPREEMDATLPLPETNALLNWRELLINQRSWLELYACQGMALEGTASERMKQVVSGLVNHYGYNSDDESLLYWTLHISVDEDHMKVGPYAVEKYAVNDDAQERVRLSLQTTLDTFWLVYDGITRAFIDKDPLYAGWRETVTSKA